MQLTNLRDVAEISFVGRVYLPAELMDGAAGLRVGVRGGGGAVRSRAAILRIRDRGLTRLPLRCAIGIRAARLIYAESAR